MMEVSGGGGGALIASLPRCMSLQCIAKECLLGGKYVEWGKDPEHWILEVLSDPTEKRKQMKKVEPAGK